MDSICCFLPLILPWLLSLPVICCLGVWLAAVFLRACNTPLARCGLLFHLLCLSTLCFQTQRSKASSVELELLKTWQGQAQLEKSLQALATPEAALIFLSYAQLHHTRFKRAAPINILHDLITNFLPIWIVTGRIRLVLGGLVRCPYR